MDGWMEKETARSLFKNGIFDFFFPSAQSHEVRFAPCATPSYGPPASRLLTDTAAYSRQRERERKREGGREGGREGVSE